MGSGNRGITGAILQSGRLFKAGDEDALAKVLPQRDIERLVAKGQLTGDWAVAAPLAIAAPAETPSSADTTNAPAIPAKASTKKGK